MTFTNTFKIVFTVILTLQFTVANASASQNETPGFEFNLDKEKQVVNVVNKNSKEVALEIPLADTEKLKRFSPKSVNQMLLDHMGRMKKANKTAWEHSYKNLPTESAVFFMAMGAVVAGQLISNYAQNPMAMQQHLEHQMSPVGLMSFWAFMYSQGVTSNILAMYIKSPKFHHFIPYLGMTVGSFTQSYISVIASDPNVRACAQVLIGGKVTQAMKESGVSQDPCEKSYEHLVVGKKIMEFAPSIVSMLASSAISGVLQSVTTKAVLRLTGVDIGMWLVPGSLQVKGIRVLLVKGLQISIFISIDHLIANHVIYAWKNLVDAADINTVNENLVKEISNQKRNQWNANNANLNNALKDLKQKGAEWRMANMSEVYQAHQAWSDNLNNLTSMYNTSYNVYSQFVNALLDFRSNSDGVKILDRAYPFYGVVASGLKEGKEDLYHSFPNMIEPMQLDTIKEVVAQIDANFANKSYEAMRFPKQYQAELKRIRNSLASDKNEVIAKGIEDLKLSLEVNVRNLRSNADSAYSTELSRILKALGKPRPLMEPGRGYLETFADAPSNIQSLKGTKFPKSSGQFMVAKITDYLTGQMICGPDAEKGESSIKHTNGFAAQFLPPSLIDGKDNFENICDVLMPSVRTEHLYTGKFRSNDGKDYDGAIGYLKHKARSSIMSSPAAFEKWWADNTESQMQKAFTEYESSYSEVIGNMLEKLTREKSTVINRGPLANGILLAIFQEARLNLIILGEILRDTAKVQKVKLPDDLFDRKQESPIKYSKYEQTGLTMPLLELIGRSRTFEFDRLSQPFTNVPDLKGVRQDPTGYRFLIQTEIDDAFIQLSNIIKQIKVVNENDTFKVTSTITNKQLEDEFENIQIKLTEMANLLGVGDNAAQAKVQLSTSQNETALLALENLRGLGLELMSFGNIANSVNWNKIRQIEGQSSNQATINKIVSEKLEIMQKRMTPGMAQ